jgi:hypothetical protein
MNAEQEMQTSDGLGGDPEPFRVVLRPYGFAVVDSATGAVLWAGSQRYKAREIAAKANREHYDQSKLDAYDNAHGLDR